MYKLDQVVAFYEANAWHRGIVVGLRRTPNPSDVRTFVRIAFGGHLPTREVAAATLDIMGRASPAEAVFCPEAGCFPGAV